ncbi:hypothetical protein UFOVP781_47 [uncultured Caudovirales phage]|uniref:Uncharacterized protein n=1 Tax=uncultured Caudovirales phage TaxID=2100421 RepID=A0A6J5LMF8_9CAUD|nr:hypothetical protein UFOVP279_16 [uncultured Caudovirales phage]CAB4162456.1 hypothetical protein UFOVP781_47 [uncultured Caudovirales phage]
MSYNDFNDRAKLTIGIAIEGTGQFSPFLETYGAPMNWSLTGTVASKTPEINLSIKEKTCGVPYGSTKEFELFGGGGSTGNTSGTVNTGQLPPPVGALLGQSLIGTWTVNTDPELSEGGYADDTLISGGYYIVAQPKNQKIDDPIKVLPAIDYITRVYPGDFVYVTGKNETSKWNVAPQNRFPKTDRTISWRPNSEPVLSSGGLVDDVLALPGTIMLPTSDYYISDPDDAIDGMQYFYANQGVIFDGQVWRKNLPDPRLYEPEDGPREFRQLQVFYGGQLYERLLEFKQSEKCFVSANLTIDDSTPLTFTVTPPEGDAYTSDLYFYWMSPMNGAERNIQPSVPAIHDFGDPWSKYHIANRDWINLKFPGELGAGFLLKTRDVEPQQTLFLGVDEIVDENITEMTDTTQDPDGNDLINTFTITFTMATAIE